MSYELQQGDAVSLPFADLSVDLVLGSPPYGPRRTYGIKAQRGCNAWVEWMLQVTTEALRVSRGAVIWVAAGWTEDFIYQPGPEGLMYEWWRRGGSLYRPCYWHRVGIAGSGKEDWFRADVEYCLCFKRPGPLPWADNTAMGHPPKWAPGGTMSHRLTSGVRRNQWGHSGTGERADRREDGSIGGASRPSHHIETVAETEGRDPAAKSYDPPKRANPGNLISIPVGGGLLGHPLAHENEAPFPEALAEWFIKSLCPPGGTVLDCFSGSGTSVAVAHRLGRHGIGIDIRPDQVELARRRLETPITPKGKKRKPVSRDMDLRSTIVARIKSMGYSLGSLGREVGVDPSVISRYVRGERGIEAATFERLIGALGLVLVPRETTVGRAGVPPCPTEEEVG
jgi:hypothetical protein